MELKVCTSCKNEYPATAEYFHRCKSVKSGLKAQCKPCASIANKANHARYYSENKEKVNARNRDNYFKKHPKEVIPDGHKRCTLCNEIKPFDAFGKSGSNKDGVRSQCKDCRRQEYIKNRSRCIERARLNYQNNKQRHAESVKIYRQKNIEWYREYNRRYYQENMAKIKENAKKSLYRRIENDDGFKILQRLRKRMYEAVKGTVKSAKTIELIGCSTERLKEHLESQFQDGMSWLNYGEWHVDHIVPCASFDFTKDEDQLACFHYTNLQPLWAIDNIRKSNKLI